ncbi:MAG: radical SAM protein [Deltaproteobacteria bacterium]|nr:radical SAM protein [Deltaproteobacteria bacterium]
MRILLAAPFPYRLVTPLGLGYLATALRRAGHDVELKNPVTGRDDPGAFAEWCRRRGFDVVGLQVMTSERNSTRALLAALRDQHPKALRLVGGPHVTGRGIQILEELTDAHYALCGEAELSLPKLLGSIDRRHRPLPGKRLADIPGLVYRTDKGLRQNPVVLIEDLDSLGPLPWDLFDIEGYNEQPGASHDRYPWYWIATSRGCPYSCSYCMGHVLGQGRMRFYSPKYIVDEIEQMKRLGIPALTLADDTPTADRRHFVEFCLELESRGLNMPWDIAGNGTRFETLDEELLQLMERTGCRRVAVAMESGSARILERFGRHYDPWQAVRRINELAQSTHMGFEVFFMLGHPDETDTDVFKTLKILLALRVDRAAVGLFSPWPGTPITNELERQGRLPALPDKSFLYKYAALPTRTISIRRLRFYQMLLYATFFARPGQASKLFREMGAKFVFGSAARLLSTTLGLKK